MPELPQKSIQETQASVYEDSTANDDAQAVTAIVEEPEVVPLSKEERVELAELEKEIEECKEAFLRLARAMKLINQKKLYREEYETFDEYCRVKLGMDKRYAYYHIDAAEVINNLQDDESEHRVHLLPTSESQVRALKGFSPEKQRELWAESIERAGGAVPSRSIVNAVVSEVKQKKSRFPTLKLDPGRWVRVISSDEGFREYRQHLGTVVAYNDEDGTYEIALPQTTLTGVPHQAVVPERKGEKPLVKPRREGRRVLFDRLKEMYPGAEEDGEDRELVSYLLRYFHTRPPRETEKRGNDMKLTEFEKKLLKLVEGEVIRQSEREGGLEEE